MGSTLTGSVWSAQWQPDWLLLNMYSVSCTPIAISCEITQARYSQALHQLVCLSESPTYLELFFTLAFSSEVLDVRTTLFFHLHITKKSLMSTDDHTCWIPASRQFHTDKKHDGWHCLHNLSHCNSICVKRILGSWGSLYSSSIYPAYALSPDQIDGWKNG